MNKHIVIAVIVGMILSLMLIFLFLIPDFPYNIYKRIHNIAELAAVVVAIMYYPYLKDSFMKWFLPYHLLVFVAELWAWYLFYFGTDFARATVNYLVGIVASVFYGYVFYRFAVDSKRKTQIRILTILAVIGQLATFLIFANGINGFPLRYNWVVSGFLTCLVSLISLHSNSGVDSIRMRFASAYWLALGTCLFYSGISIVLACGQLIQNNHLDLFGVNLVNMIIRLLCVVLYGCTCVSMVSYARSQDGQRLSSFQSTPK